MIKKIFINYTSDKIKNNKNEIWFSNCEIKDEFCKLIIFIEDTIDNKKEIKSKKIEKINNKINELFRSIFY